MPFWKLFIIFVVASLMCYGIFASLGFWLGMTVYLGSVSILVYFLVSEGHLNTTVHIPKKD